MPETRVNGLVPVADVVCVLRLSEEQVCAGYLAARKAMVAAGTRVLSLGRLVAEHPGRTDYRRAWFTAQANHAAALNRTEIAYSRWTRAQLRTDAAWSATTGRAAA
ncbi:hypothetical protein [Actinokineospora terrae]|uniref:Uncharacterized protein n=1 Tax=Actinokineospora terrae TaxID=155974 RepID=A0A1H9VH31_9PSEU|nr:hypothetical protein [Actinokineospora terrae]SES20879.1 hypothetical protein SAMN04487818_108357 [Actinokineospora terrae]